MTAARHTGRRENEQKYHFELIFMDFYILAAILDLADLGRGSQVWRCQVPQYMRYGGEPKWD